MLYKQGTHRSVIKMNTQRKYLLLWLLILNLTTPLFSQELDGSVLEQIKAKAKATNSDAVMIAQNGKMIYKDFFGKKEQPIYIASAGKSLTSLAIGKLIDKKILDSLDQPVYTIYPEWKQGRKKEITVRMLLNHTSGLQNNPNASVELEPAPDYKVENIINLALAAELSHTPGEHLSYNNKAVALLGGIVQKLSGKSFDTFFKDEFFEPMSIEDYKWITDKSSNPTVHGAFVIRPSDLMKFGELMRNYGVYNGKQILSKAWVKASFEESQNYTPIWGLLWWRLPEYEHRIIDDDIWASWVTNDIDTAFMAKMKPMKGQLYRSTSEFYEALRNALGEDWNGIVNTYLPPSVKLSKRIYGGAIKAYYANGFRGNFLVIIPESGIVAVRCADADGFDYDKDFFTDFVELVVKLTNN